MRNALPVAREQVREVVRELKAMDFRLRGVQTSLPPSPDEVSLHDMEEMDAVTELRTAIDGFRDAIRPAIEDLEKVVNEAGEEGLAERRPPRPLKDEPTHA